MFALRLLWRDLRASEVQVLLLALIVAVGAVSGVGFVTSRVDGAMQRQSAELLAADIAVVSAHELPSAWATEAINRDLDVAHTAQFPSVVFHAGNTQLVNVKGVSTGYPLRGELRLTQSLDDAETVHTRAPPDGEVWVQPRLLSGLGLKVGDSITLGEIDLRIAAILTYEPDRGADLFQIAPRVLMNQSDLARTGLLSEQSRAKYRFLVAGPEEVVAAMRAWIKPQLNADQDLLGIEDARPEFKSALDRAQQFLNLAALASVLLAGAAVALAAFRYRQRQSDMAALLRCFGAQQNRVLRIYLLRLFGMAAIASLVGLALGWAAQALLGQVLAQMFATQLPGPSLLPAGIAVLTALLTLAGFALPSIVRLRQVPPLRVLHRNMGAPPASAIFLVLWSLLAMALLIRWQAQDTAMTGYVLGALLGVAVMFGLLAWLLLTITRVAPALLFRNNWSLRFGFAALRRRQGLSVLQIGAFSVGMAVILLLAVVRVDLLSSWQGTVSDKAPNHFLINVQPDELADVQSLLAERNVEIESFYPMIRARLTHINGSEVHEDQFETGRAKRFTKRAWNLSFTDKLPSSNQITAGGWWDTSEQGKATPQISFENKLAEAFGIGLGDEVQFDVAGQPVVARITSLRKVDWDSFQVNFFVLMNPASLKGLPATWITAFHIPETDQDTVALLAREFPTVSTIEIGNLIKQVKALMDRAALAVEGVFGFTLLAALVVFLAAFQADRDERSREISLLRTFGATRKQVRIAATLEFALLGGLAGLLSAAIANGAGWALAQKVFNLPYETNGWMWLASIAIGVLLIAGLGLSHVQKVLNQPPLEGLKQ